MLRLLILILGCNQEDNCRDYVDASNACSLAHFGAESEPLVYEEYCEPADADSVVFGCMAKAYADGDCGSDTGYSDVRDEVGECRGE